jgi:hypothetical protein
MMMMKKLNYCQLIQEIKKKKIRTFLLHRNFQSIASRDNNHYYKQKIRYLKLQQKKFNNILFADSQF